MHNNQHIRLKPVALSLLTLFSSHAWAQDTPAPPAAGISQAAPPAATDTSSPDSSDTAPGTATIFADRKVRTVLAANTAPARPAATVASAAPGTGTADGTTASAEPAAAAGQPTAMPGPATAPGQASAAPAPGSGTAADRQPIDVTAGQIAGNAQTEVTATGNVRLKRGEQTITADRARYQPPQQMLTASGNICLAQPGARVTGQDMRLNLDTATGYATQPSMVVSPQGQRQFYSRADAEQLLFEGRGHYELEQARYTQCPVGDNSWYIRTPDLKLDETTQTGTASHPSVVFKDHTILALPFIDFPMTTQRKSGFLLPHIGNSSTNGLDLRVPYYWNIAPNMDDTVSPRILSKRGLQLTNDFRYLEPGYNGEAVVEYLPHDHLTGTDRYSVLLHHYQSLAPGLSGAINYQRVSDDNYFRDLSSYITSTSQTVLPQEADLTYARGPWTLQGAAQRFQTLQDPNAPVTPPYNRNQLTLDGHQNVFGSPADFAMHGEAVNFISPDTRPNGNRLVLYPSVDYPLTASYGYVIPKIGVHFTDYGLNPQETGTPSQITRTLPITSVDSGLFFDRKTAFRGNQYIQTLEPRVYYLYIPYVNQNNIPIFDTAQADFLNFAQLFTENSFLGQDRINNANQVTTALTSRLIDAQTGQQRLNVSVGQRFQFQPQQVSIPASAANPVPVTSAPTLFTGVDGQLSDKWRLQNVLAYDEQAHHLEQASLSASYHPDVGKIFNFGYRYTRENLDQVDLSAQWPLWRRISAVGRWDYSISDAKLLEGVAGLAYNGDCYQIQAVVHHLTTGLTTASNAIYFQLQLGDLASVGSNPFSLLQRNVTGYSSFHPTNNQGLTDRDL